MTTSKEQSAWIASNLGGLMDPKLSMRTGSAAVILWKRPADRVQRNVRRFEVPKYQASIDIGSDRGITADFA
jgi:hypothetical protein